MSTQNSLSIAESYEVNFITKDYPTSDGWNFISTMTDSVGMTIEAIPNYGIDGYDISTGTYKFVFTSDLTGTLQKGNAVLSIRLEREYNPVRLYREIKYLVTRHNLAIIDPIDNQTTEAYYLEMLRRVQETLKARAGDGVQEYQVADYGMKYIAIEKLIEMEKYYQAKVDQFYKNTPSVMQVKLL